MRFNSLLNQPAATHGGRRARRASFASRTGVKRASSVHRRAQKDSCCTHDTHDGSTAPPKREVKAEGEIPGMTPFLDSLKWDVNNLVAAIVQVGLMFYLYHRSIVEGHTTSTSKGTDYRFRESPTTSSATGRISLLFLPSFLFLTLFEYIYIYEGA